MEEGEVSSGSEGELGGYTPLQRPENPKPHAQPNQPPPGGLAQLGSF